MIKPITKPKQRASSKMIKKKGNGVVATSGKKGATAEKSGTAPASKGNPAIDKVKITETASLNKLTANNQRLTRQLEKQKRELEIEAALERVRTASSAMVKTDELSRVVSVMYKQFELLKDIQVGLELILCDEAKSEIQFWSSSLSQKNSPNFYTIQKASHPFFKKQWDAWKAKKDRLVITLDETRYKEFCKFIFSQTDFKKFPNHVKKFIRSRKKYVFTHVSMKYGLLEAVADEALSDEGFSLLQRFARVFEQTYTRFLDLKKAEAQTRQAQVEAALERLRARSMAMHQSGELNEIVAVVYEQLSQLGFDSSSYLLRTREDRKEAFNTWLSFKEISTLPKGYYLPKLNNPIHKRILRAWDDQEQYKVIEFGGDEKRKYDNLLFTKTSWKEFPQKAKKAIRSMDYAVICLSSFRHVGLQAIGTEPLPDDKAEILVRFARVFEQTYTRFLDLQKAEEQTHEAEVELALERVRAKTMAMHRSDELREVVAILYEQMTALGLAALGCELILCDEETDLLQYWSVAPGAELPDCYPVPRKSYPFFQNLWQAWKKRTPRLVVTLRGQEKKKFDNHIFEKTAFKTFPERAKKIIKAGKVDVFSLVTMKYGLLEAVDTIPLPEDKFPILERFANVFEQAYTRFLDLQKAETQAREAQIEAALERVRAKSMAMHRSEELQGVAEVLREQMKNLGQPELEGTVIELYDLHSDYIESWHTFKPAGRKGSKLVTGKEQFRKDSCALIKEMIQMYKSGSTDYTLVAKGKKLKEWYRVLSEKVPQVATVTVPEVMYYHCSDFSGGTLLLATADRPSTEAKVLLSRSSKVFDQAYRRFRDLQKAEAQAREAQIEAALERVRAKSLAMHKSEELRELVFEFYKQIQPFGFAKWGFEIKIAKEDKSGFYCWISPPGARILPEGFNVPTLDHWVLKKYWLVFKNQVPITTIEVSGDDKKRLGLLLLQKSEMKHLPQEVKTNILDTGYVRFSLASMRFGLLKAVDIEPILDKDINILQRFAKVFEQTYTRFLDLQKAEEQAREAQIEAALERVRSRSMAMHQTSELNEVSMVLYDELRKLGFQFISCGFNIVLEEKQIHDVWNYDFSRVQLTHFQMPLLGDITLKERYQAWKDGAAIFLQELSGTALNEHLRITAPEELKREKNLIFHFNFPNPAYFCFANFSKGYLYVIGNIQIQIDYQNILVRFAKVFEQAYIRFLDLQKAEALAREAQIEAALERVRSLTMAMHSSEDVGNCIVKMFDELTRLGVDEGTRFGIGILNRANENSQLWTARKYGKEVKLHIGNLDMTLHPLLISARTAWKEQVPLHQYILQGDDLLNYYEMLNTARDYKIKVAIKKLPEKEFHYGFIFEHGFFYAFSPCEFQPGLIHTAQRFSALFEQTYRRYLDLQKAEAQAREALIEVALERVRSRSLAMHKAEELGEVVTVVLEKLKELGIPVNDGVALVTHIEGSKDQIEWMENPGYATALKVYQPYYDHPILVDYWKAKEKGIDFIAPRYTAKQNRSFLKHIFEHTHFKHVPQEIKDYCLAAKTYSYSAAFQKHSSIFINDYSGRSLTEHEKDIVKRFSKVFEQAYTRFLDLQKAEEQAREAQIEAALERVRSRSMAMHKSDELIDTATLLYQELVSLGIPPYSTGFVLVDEENSRQEVWFSGPGGAGHMDRFFLPLTGDPILDERYRNWKNKEPVYHERVEGARLIEHLKFISSFFGTREAEQQARQQAQQFPEAIVFYCGYFPEGYLHILTEIILDAGQESMMKRFTQVFAMTYRRFLDLKKAETQAREAQIEASLERVRARTMAMHKSEELSEASTVLFQQLRGLGGNLWTAGFALLNANEVEGEFRVSNPEGEIQLPIYIPNTEDPATRNMYLHWEKGVDYYAEEAGGEELKKHYDYLLSLPKARPAFQAMLDAGITLPTWQQWHAAYFSQGYLLVITLEPYEEAGLLKRFANAFQQTYTRFLDLQKAEAQAREAEIQLALERIRARSMAMQSSEELREVVQVMYDQVGKLGIAKWGCMLLIFDKEKQIIQGWFSEIVNAQYPRPFDFSNKDHVIIQKWWDFWESEEESLSIHLRDEEKHDFGKYLFTKTGMKYMPDEVKEVIMNEPQVYFEYTNMDFGLIEFIDIEPFPEECIPVLKRITKVFEQTYTRFLDLQKAEAQAREAQIEAALERVRSRTMGMHKSDEMLEVGELLYKELSKLGITAMSSGVTLIDKEGKMDSYYVVNPSDGSIMREPMGIPRDETKVMRSLTEGWEKQEPYHITALNEEETIIHQTYIAENSTNFPFTAEQLIAITPKRLNLQTFNFKQGFLTVVGAEKLPQDKVDTTIRFAKAFEQTYTRFLDLQKAEAQAREAKIEAALERVRSRTMAMHKSDELSDVASLLFQQIGELGIKVWTAGFNIWMNNDTAYQDWITSPTGGFIEPYLVDTTQFSVFIEVREAKQRGDEFFVQYVGGDTIKAMYGELSKFAPKQFEIMLRDGFEFPKHQYDHFVFGSTVSLMFITFEPLPEAHTIFKRFGKVFEQTYTRFLDLQKAESQAREAQIEVALERVRARMMAMHRSEELREVVGTTFNQLQALGFDAPGSAIIIYDSDLAAEHWMTGFSNSEFPESYKIPYNDHPYFTDLLNAWQNGVPFQEFYFEGDLKIQYAEWCLAYSDFNRMPPEFKNEMKNPARMVISDAFNKYGMLEILGTEPLSKERIVVLQRFSKVFEQTYTRFLDLQKAEEQAREAQIEAALERVRASAMAMHKSDDLRHVVAVVFKELELSLNIQICTLLIFDAEATEIEWWSTAMVTDVLLPQSYKVPLTDTIKDNKLVKRYLGALQQGLQYDVFELSGETKRSWDRYLFEHTELKQMPKETQEAMMSFECVFLADAFMSHGTLEIAGPEPLPEDKGLILQRFAKVIDLTYRRVEDLQKAEAQAREAQIEAALEKVRSRSMAMHKSDELLDVVNTVFERLRDLDLPIDAAAIFVFEKGDYEFWFATADSKYPTGMHLPTRGNQVVDDLSNARETLVSFFSKLYSFDEKNQYFHHIFENTDFRHVPDERKKFLLECESLSLSVALEKNSGILLNSYTGKVLSPKEVDVLKRFTRVFEQAYTRFLDLQRAEAQAREAQIEAALERVRSRSMAMQRSDELNEVLTTMFAELSSLGLALARCVIWTFNNEDRSARWWAANPEEESGTESFLIPCTDHPTCNEYWKSWEERRTRYFYELSGETKRTWDDYLFNHTDMARLPEPVKAGMKAPEKVLLYNSFRDFGVLFAVSLEPLSEENFDIIERFGKVFDQSYTRFKDIQQAEAREMEAIRQASLDRVRAEIASMRTAKDLERITPLIWKELNTLTVPFIRCGVFIMNEDLQIIHNFLSTPDGKAIASFQLPYDTPGFVANILKHWREKKMLLDHWDENGMKNFAQVLVNQGIFNEPGQYLKTLPKEGLYLHMLPFLQGMLYVGNTSQLAPENLDLLLSLADAFSTAYARYEDFNKLEAAKQQVDNALVNLKQAQQQLVQSEKMASLGQLTAGIAHEIQNPLNFVNNFSEVNEELLAEMKDELRNGKIDDALALADNVLENQKKINHHGKRADGIVKGMLQHSRSSSGVKEPTDINVLADEYLRLAFHGLRAKDKSFNAKFTTDFDPTIEAINVVPQEIGRVILNLINNAFYAVTEKQKKGLDGYEPAVAVSTKNSGGQILISVKDNGNGIPDSIKEKIFQPFFTTKPTGQGTGLGLSLSYDIVKAHGGELKVETKDGEGSGFSIHLPIV